jgi:cytochrome c-type biogenesis protein CcmH
MTRYIWLIVCAFAISTGLLAQEPLKFESTEQAERFNALTAELRCLVCQNQTLADSDAQLAQDLRQEVYNLMTSGKTDEEIKSFLVERYGDFVLYRPPLGTNTMLLWFMPILLLIIGGAVLFIVVRRQQSVGLDEVGLDDSEGGE